MLSRDLVVGRAKSRFALLALLFVLLAPGSAEAAHSSTVAGADRFATAAAQAAQAYPRGCAAVIVVESDAWPDALSAAGLAGALDCPILFTGKDAVPAATAGAISSLGASEVVLIGDERRVSERGEAALGSTGAVKSVRRVCGRDRYETQQAVYDFGRGGYDGVDRWGRGLAVLASGASFPDALSASPLAASEAAPIFLVDPANPLPASQQEALLEGGFSRIVVLGDEGAVSERVLGYARGLTALASPTSTPDAVRLGGADRYETSAALARWCVQEGYLSWDGAAFTSGTRPYDAMAGGVLQAKRGAVMLLADHSSNATVVAAASNRGSMSNIVYFGDSSAVSTHLRIEIEYRLGWYNPTSNDLLNNIESSNGSWGGVVQIGTDFLPSSPNYNRLSDAINWIRSSGYNLGFMMVDLKTGQGVASSSEQFFYSASTIKGPYVASINKYDPGSAWAYSGIMQQTIGISSNSGYATLRNRFGSWCFARYLADAQVGSFNADTWYPYFRVKDLAKLWVANYDYFYNAGQNVNTPFCRSLFTSSYHSPLYYELGGRYTVHSKPGWIVTGYPRAFNDAGIIMAGDRPYLVVICSNATERFDMLQNLTRVLDDVHSEMVK